MTQTTGRMWGCNNDISGTNKLQNFCLNAPGTLIHCLVLNRVAKNVYAQLFNAQSRFTGREGMQYTLHTLYYNIDNIYRLYREWRTYGTRATGGTLIEF